MTTPVQDSPVSRQQARIWSGVGCSSRFCQRCNKIPFNDEEFNGFAAVPSPGRTCLQLPPDLPEEHGQHDLELDFTLIDVWPKLNVLNRSAEDCDFCKLLEIQLRKTGLPPDFEGAWIRIELFYCWRNRVYQDQVHDFNSQDAFGLLGLKARVFGKLKQEDEFTALVWLKFTIDADKGECKRWSRLQSRPNSEILCGESISKITARLKSTDNKPRSTFIPTRLVDLGCYDKSSQFARLVTKEEAYKEWRTFPMYVALSYRWGSLEQAATQTKTTHGNIHDRMASIDLQAVSKVIQDAAIVCKLFGVRYLWVDALCIVQGDSQDWERESTNMGSIFRNAYFTIATASIDSCNESFLSQNINTLEVPFVSRIDPNVRGTYRLIGGHHEDGNVHCLIDSEDTENFSGSWMSRGWVFQEIAMSSRLLMFGRTMATLVDEGLRYYFHVVDSTVDYSDWRHLVASYSGGELTFEKDRLPAISGLARFYAEHLKDNYLAGIWKSDLYISLFWYNPPEPFSERRSLHSLINTITSHRSYVAPSWSWASTKEAIEFGTWGFHPQVVEYQARVECNIIDAQCILGQLDPFGIVQGGYITLSAKVLRLQRNELFFIRTTGWQKGHYDWYLDGETPVMQTFLDGNPGQGDPQNNHLVFLLLGSCNDYGPRASDLVGDDDDDETGNDTFLEGERCAYGLVLYPAQGVNTFYRVGLFSSQVQNHKPHGGLKFCETWEVETVTII
ncbi:heterokaryon incompatibility protein-domain-containing protein [Fusarium avenaceum]|nr:heterokaryon incompatibility protein-domain-containing protein [Fusarium avenaceum]